MTDGFPPLVHVRSAVEKEHVSCFFGQQRATISCKPFCTLQSSSCTKRDTGCEIRKRKLSNKKERQKGKGFAKIEAKKYRYVMDRRREENKMCLKPQPIESVPEETARIARRAYPKGNIYLQLRDTFGTIYQDEDFVELYPQRGQP